MQALDPQYQEHLDKLQTAIQDSELLANYLDEEGDEEYKLLVDTFEPHIHQLHESVTFHNPLQLLALEKALLVDGFEGLYIPRLLGYTVLRGYVGEDGRFSKPQDHFKDIILYSVGSANFEQIQKRIGQAIQIGFALSSDIWIANIINQVENKKVRSYLEGQKLYKYQDIKQRMSGLFKYKKQFQSLRFMTATFPETKQDLILDFEVIRHFLKLRIDQQFDNTSVLPTLNKFIANEDLHDTREFVELMIRIGLYYELDAAGQKQYTEVFNKLRKNFPEFEKIYMNLINEHWLEVKEIPLESEKRMCALIGRASADKITGYYNTLDTVYKLGYVHDDAIEAVSTYYYSNEGRSIENSNMRSAIFSQISRVVNNLEVDAYTDWFDLQKVVTRYIEIFTNQQFNQDIKMLYLGYIKKLLKVYIDKRGRDYQDIKKFVKTTFLDLGLMTEKQLVELFKTKRKKKEVTEK